MCQEPPTGFSICTCHGVTSPPALCRNGMVDGSVFTNITVVHLADPTQVWQPWRPGMHAPCRVPHACLVVH